MKRLTLNLISGVCATAILVSAADLDRQLPSKPLRTPADAPLAGPEAAIDPATGLPITDEKRFSLDFKGGTPADLVKAIERATDIPLNVIIPNEHAKVPLPPLKLSNVTVPQVFQALTMASEKVQVQVTGTAFGVGGNRMPQFQTTTASYGFKTPGQAGSSAIWYFYVKAPPELPALTDPAPARNCRFWQLETYLERFKIEDITTAIETGWKMLGIEPTPKISFHKDTKLLIAVGTQDELRIIDEALRELTLRKEPPKFVPPTAVPAPFPRETKP